jgi:hypothetical protein
MSRRTIAFTLLVSAMSLGTGYAQPCLHGPNETPDQAARRLEALTAARIVNTIEANQPGSAKGVFLRHAELADSPYAAKMREATNEAARRISLNPSDDILPQWTLTLDVTEKGYWFMIKDTADPCGFAYISNQRGLILRAEPIR